MRYERRHIETGGSYGHDVAVAMDFNLGPLGERKVLRQAHRETVS
jgi:hypothetical protein